MPHFYSNPFSMAFDAGFIDPLYSGGKYGISDTKTVEDGE
jgi:hypothetical protein